MKSKRMRTIVLLVTCISLIFSCAVPASALGFEWVVKQIATDVAVTGILEGLGVFRDSLNGNDYFNNLVSNVKQHLVSAGQVTLEFAEAYWRIDPLNNNSVLTVPLALITAVRNYIFDNGIVRTASLYESFGFGDTVGIYTYNQPVSRYMWNCGFKTSHDFGIRHYEYVIGTVPDKILTYTTGDVITSTQNRISLNGTEYYMHIVSSGTKTKWFSLDYGSIGSAFTASGYPGILYEGKEPDNISDVLGTQCTEVTTPHSIALGQISPPNTEFNVAYPQWLEHERELEDGVSESMVQIGLGNTVGETESLTQEQIWAGQGSVSVPGQDVTDASLADILRSIIALPGQFVTSIITALSNFFSISGESDSYAIQLKDFFPFCIPFDIFDFLSVLSADPQAPVFHWELPVPQLGRTFEIDVDLSAWDPVAAVFRTFELLAFVVGLGMVTREKFLRS